MDHTTVTSSSPETTVLRSRSSSGSISAASPANSVFSRGHSSRSSTSSTSMASSPLPTRDSLDLYGSVKRLEDVREEPQEREDEWMQGDEENEFSANPYGQSYLYSSPPTNSPLQTEYSLGDSNSWSNASLDHQQSKRQRSAEHRNSISDRFTSRFGSLSRRWKNRSSIGPQLSIITHPVPTGQRSSSASSSHIVSPALSAISKHESYLPASPVHINLDEALSDSVVVPIYMEEEPRDTVHEIEEETCQAQATTPLLPPVMANLSKKPDSPLHSPLQSPSIAATAYVSGSRVSIDGGAHALPSPPLSQQPSVASIQRSKDNHSLTHDIPPLQLGDLLNDPWAIRLGHANFSIHPEPYFPDALDIDSYKEFRANWDLARKQYAQHLARTNEHYGETSKIYRLTQEKWGFIDNAWKEQDAAFINVLSPALMRLSDSDSTTIESPVSPNILEKPLTRIVVPPMDKSGKFPEMGDADIVGPLSVAPAKAQELQRRCPQTPPESPRKRNLFKYLSDVLGRSAV